MASAVPSLGILAVLITAPPIVTNSATCQDSQGLRHSLGDSITFGREKYLSMLTVSLSLWYIISVSLGRRELSAEQPPKTQATHWDRQKKKIKGIKVNSVP